MNSILNTSIDGFTCKRGKVRDVYDLGDMLIIIATDRISAFDWVLPNTIPGKGRILTAMTLFWLNTLPYQNHLVSTDFNDMPEAFRQPELAGRMMLVKKCKVFPVECIVRGYLAGSAWGEYAETGSVCAIKLPAYLRKNQQFPEPIFTPSTKAETGHDENITCKQMENMIGREDTLNLRKFSIDIYQRAARLAWDKGVAIADTKFEWGRSEGDGSYILVDEVLTPDSSRFWRLQDYQLGVPMEAMDKQYVRDYLVSVWDNKGNKPPPPLPENIIQQTQKKYLEAYRLLTGEEFELDQ